MKGKFAGKNGRVEIAALGFFLSLRVERRKKYRMKLGSLAWMEFFT